MDWTEFTQCPNCLAYVRGDHCQPGDDGYYVIPGHTCVIGGQVVEVSEVRTTIPPIGTLALVELETQQLPPSTAVWQQLFYGDPIDPECAEEPF